jgi:pimeloyl-ACP methyl ester carboxylesterase
MMRRSAELPSHDHIAIPCLCRYRTEHEAVLIMEVADAVGWGEDTGGFTLLAHSRGTSVSLIAACAFPERVDHVVLVESRLGACVWTGNKTPVVFRSLFLSFAGWLLAVNDHLSRQARVKRREIGTSKGVCVVFLVFFRIQLRGAGSGGCSDAGCLHNGPEEPYQENPLFHGPRGGCVIQLQRPNLCVAFSLRCTSCHSTQTAIGAPLLFDADNV